MLFLEDRTVRSYLTGNTVIDHHTWNGLWASYFTTTTIKFSGSMPAGLALHRLVVVHVHGLEIRSAATSKSRSTGFLLMTFTILCKNRSAGMHSIQTHISILSKPSPLRIQLPSHKPSIHPVRRCRTRRLHHLIPLRRHTCNGPRNGGCVTQQGASAPRHRRNRDIWLRMRCIDRSVRLVAPCHQRFASRYVQVAEHTAEHSQ